MSGSSPLPLVVGLTGNIGTGKSTVTHMLSELGAEVIDADKVAHEMMRAGTPVHAKIIEAFGREILASDGEIDRKRMGVLVFADPAALARLEALTHPATITAISHRIGASFAPVVVVEAIKLIESGMAAVYDSVWVVTCTPEQQIRRIMAQRGLSRQEAEQRVRAQPSQAEKIAHADVVIDNSGFVSHTREQVEDAWERLIAVGREGHSEYNYSNRSQT
jgi:dephospho-CoA kinase